MGKTNFNIIQRFNAPTSKFFKIVRNVGIGLTAVGGAIATAPVSLPAIIVTLGGYLAVAGGVMSAVAQSTVEGD